MTCLTLQAVSTSNDSVVVDMGMLYIIYQGLYEICAEMRRRMAGKIDETHLLTRRNSNSIMCCLT